MRLFKLSAATAALLSFALAGCAREGDIQQTGILTTYTACPPVAIVAPAGDITLFNPPSSRDSTAIDVVAHITNVRSTCDETGEYIVTNASFIRTWCCSHCRLSVQNSTITAHANILHALSVVV